MKLSICSDLTLLQHQVSFLIFSKQSQYFYHSFAIAVALKNIWFSMHLQRFYDSMN